MNTQAGFEKCLTFINSQLQPPGKPRPPSKNGQRRAVVISRQSASGAHEVAGKLARYLQARPPNDGPPWTVFDRNLMEKVLADHHLPQRLARFIPEDRISEIDDIMAQLFGLRPPADVLVQQTSETILHLAELGNVILLGRGSAVITADLPHVFRVRLVAPLEKRIEYVRAFEGISREAARARIRQEDRGRKRYFKKYFREDNDDPLLYHLVINTGLVSLDDATRMIGEAVLNRSVARPPA